MYISHLTLVPKGLTIGSMSNRFFPCKTQTRSRNQNPFSRTESTESRRRTVRLTWRSASSSSRSCPVAMGITSSTLTDLAPAQHDAKHTATKWIVSARCRQITRDLRRSGRRGSPERSGLVRRKAAAAEESGAARAAEEDAGVAGAAVAAARRSAGARVWRRRHMAVGCRGQGTLVGGGGGNGDGLDSI
jgi:hypothetical protein